VLKKKIKNRAFFFFGFFGSQKKRGGLAGKARAAKKQTDKPCLSLLLCH
jgi:hypothetical protein